MNKFFMGTAVFALVATAASADSVRVYNWSDYIDEELLEKFEAETGLDLIYDVFDSNEVLETKMLAGGSGYDVVVPTADFLQRQISAGAFQKLDKSKLSNMDNMWDVIEARTDQYDPGNEYAINYMWGTTGLGVNVGKVTEILGDDAPLSSMELVLNRIKADVSQFLFGLGFLEDEIWMVGNSYDNLKDTLRYVEIDTGRDQKEKPPDRNWK